MRKSTKKPSIDFSALYKGRGGGDLSKEVIQELSQFTKRRSNAVIDVYWLYDDGGLTLLLPYIISTRHNWNSCKLRYNNNNQFETYSKTFKNVANYQSVCVSQQTG